MDPSSGTTIWNIIMWWAGLAGAAGPAPNAAERGYSLQYQAAASCPDSSALTQAIRVQAEALATLPATVRATQGNVELQLTAARLHLCPLRFTVGQSLQLVPRLTGDAGSLRAQGTGTTVNPQSVKMTWLAVGGTARAQLALGRVVSLESWLGLRGLAGGADRFEFNPGVLAYQVPQWSLGAGLGVAATLP